MWESLPLDPDTTILSRSEIEFCGWPAVVESWSWDGQLGRSLILKEESSLDFEQSATRLAIRKALGLTVDDFKIKRSSGFIFISGLA